MLVCAVPWGSSEMGGRSYKHRIPQEDPQCHQLAAPQFICRGGGASHSSFGPQQGLPTDLQHGQSLGWQQQGPNSKRQTRGSDRWSCLLMLLP